MKKIVILLLVIVLSGCSKIKTGEYDIDLLSEAERHQVEIYLTKNSG